MVDIVSNTLTGQGTEKDVDQNFEIKQIITNPLTSYQLRSLVASDSYCERVVSYLAKSMGNVMMRKSDVAVRKLKRSRDVSNVISWINDNIRALSPWFVESQKEANIVGKAYLVLRVDYEREPSDPYINFPFARPVDWNGDAINYGIRSISGVRVVGGDVWEWSKGREYLVRRFASISVGTLTENRVLSWVEDKSKLSESEIESNQYEVVHKSHVLEFTAFDYQDDRDALRLQSPRLANKLDNRIYYGISFRLTRFVPYLLRYLSFVYAVLNRMHRSESIIYKKENLGEVNQAIARYLSQSTDSQLVSNVDELIKEELTRLEKSLRTFGVALIDKKNEVEITQRTMSGINDLSNVFARDLIAASGLTEFSLFGMTSQGAGLANMDVRDRAAIAKQTDELFAEHWSPLILYIANCLALSSGRITTESHILYVNQQNSFELSELESSEWLEKRVKILLDLLSAGVIDNEVVRRELADNSNIGRYFNFTNDDVERLRPII